MSKIIPPTPGRIVWYRPAPNDNIPAIINQPLAAIVAAVHHERTVNLSVIDAYGHHHSRQNVYLVQPDIDGGQTAPYAEWMPYQISQTAKCSGGCGGCDKSLVLPVVEDKAISTSLRVAELVSKGITDILHPSLSLQNGNPTDVNDAVEAGLADGTLVADVAAMVDEAGLGSPARPSETPSDEAPEIRREKPIADDVPADNSNLSAE